MTWLSDADYAEEVRAAAVCGGGPNAKLYQAERVAEQRGPRPFFAETEAELDERHRRYEFDAEPETPEETMRRVAAEVAFTDRHFDGFRG